MPTYLDVEWQPSRKKFVQEIALGKSAMAVRGSKYPSAPLQEPLLVVLLVVACQRFIAKKDTRTFLLGSILGFQLHFGHSTFPFTYPSLGQ